MGNFVGREHELSQAQAALEDMLAGHGRLVLAAGESGIGKSRLADELATRARGRGVQVAWGRCWEAGGAPAYWPWVQSLRALIRGHDADQLRSRMAGGAADVAQLLPEIAPLVGPLPQTPPLSPDRARFRLFDSATTLLKNEAASQPIMLILDDLQVADTPSLLLLRFLASALGDDRILVFATYRDTEVSPGHPLADALTELIREQVVRRILLRGLGPDDVGRYINAAAGFVANESLIRAVHEQTEGNPLFVEEVTRLLLEEGRLLDGALATDLRVGMPRSIRDVIGTRLRHLPDDSVKVLTLASVIGREFALHALSGLAGEPLDVIVAALDAPLAAGVITAAPGTKERLRFSHVVVRECLYDDIGMAKRIQLHRQAAQVLEALYADDLEPHLSELAHHFFEGAPGGEVEKAVRVAERAGDRAVSLLAYEEAVRLHRMALQGLGLSQRQDATERTRLMLKLGDAQARAGDQVGSKETFLEAANLARGLGLSDRVAQAALGYGGRHVWERASGDRHIVPLLRDGLTAIGEGDSALRAKLLARLAGALRDNPSPEPRESLGREAVDVARRLDDPSTLAYTLDAMFAALWRPNNPHERLGIAREIVSIGEQTGDREQILFGHIDLLLVFFELGDIRSVHEEQVLIDAVAEELREPALNWLAATSGNLNLLLEGRFDEAEASISRTRRLGDRSRRRDAVSAHTLQLFQMRREQARLAEMEGPITSSAREFTWYPMHRCALAILHWDLGHQQRARTEFSEIAAEDFAGLPFDNNWLFGMSLASELAYLLGDGRRAAILHERLLPYADRNALAPPEGVRGSVSRYLGLLSAAMSAPDDAIRHLEHGLDRNEQMEARPWVAHTQHDLAVLLLQRGGTGDRQRAVELLNKADTICDELGMPALQARLTAALEVLGATISDSPAPVEDGTFRRAGEYWTIGYQGRALTLRDSKGIRVLAELLTEPGRPHPALDLERLGAAGDEVTARAIATGDAGELIDDEARRAYRRRLAELRANLEDAAASGNADHVGAMQEEADFIMRELGRALGLGGRSRRAGSVAERARLNVTRAAKSAIRRIAAADAGLAAHLAATVHTGTVCVYTPDPRSPIKWLISPGDVHSR